MSSAVEVVNAVTYGIKEIISHFFNRKEAHIEIVTLKTSQAIDQAIERLPQRAPIFVKAFLAATEESKKAYDEWEATQEPNNAEDHKQEPIQDLGASA